MDWFAIKVDMLEWAGISRDLAHIYAGVAIQLGVAALLGRSLASIVPLGAVLALELVNEWYDVRHVGGFEAMTPQYWQAAYWDIGVTMALPVLLFLLSRFWPGLLVDPARSSSAEATTPEPKPDEPPQEE